MSDIKEAISAEEVIRLYREATIAYIEDSRKRLDRLKVLLVEAEGDQSLTDRIQTNISNIETKIQEANKELGVS